MIRILIYSYVFLFANIEIVNCAKVERTRESNNNNNVLSLAGQSQPESYSSEESENFSPEIISDESMIDLVEEEEESSFPSWNASTFINRNATSCSLNGFIPDFDSVKIFPKFGFHDPWIRQKWFWNAGDFNFEQRYNQRFKSRTPPPSIRVFIIPHSHSDPGWLKTFEGYFNSNTKHTLDLAVEKLERFPNMTFVWNEIVFLSKWWDNARLEQREGLLRHVADGRLEILTGGWVMQDEATVNLYSMIDQIIEGRQWVKSRIGITPNISWSIDPFGHGSALPYILKTADIRFMVIQRLHYAWKKYFGEKQYGNFEWVQRWDKRQEHSITCHNAPFDLYTTKHTCGPDPLVCLKFDFRNIYGEYSEYMKYARPVTKSNIRQLAEQLVEQLQKTASLQPHNVVMFPLGDDFRFDKSLEWDQQYENYVPLINYINENWDLYRVHITFGIVSDYFNAIKSFPAKLPTFTGDFFPYSDIYVSGRPAYWTGFYGTRPFWKKLYRETESSIRGAEIAYTYALNLCQQSSDRNCIVMLSSQYESLIKSRRNLALFAHHDGATGTSRRLTMDDYGRKLLQASKSSMDIQRQSIYSILKNALNLTISHLALDYQIENFGDNPTKIARLIYETESIVKKVVFYNSLGWSRTHLAKILITSPNVAVIGMNGESIKSQINPVITFDDKGMKFRDRVFELCFLAELAPLSVSIFEIRKSGIDEDQTAKRPSLTCNDCSAEDRVFEIEQIQPGSSSISLGNGNVELLLSSETGMLRKISKLREDLSTNVYQSYGGYRSVFRDSGAYLLKPDVESVISIPFEEATPKILVVEGPITSYLTLYHAPLKLTTRLIKSSDAIYLESMIDLGSLPAEVYMRFDTQINSTTSPNNDSIPTPTFYTDQNGFTYEKRIKVPSIKYEGNNYPVNTMAYIQDPQARFTIQVDRAHGFSSMEPGRLETLIERRTQFDDGRGMNEGVTDNKRTLSNYVILLESLQGKSKPRNKDNEKDNDTYNDNEDTIYSTTLPTLNSLHSSHSLNYPVSTFGYDDIAGSFVGKYSFLRGGVEGAFPQDTHLINLRTLSRMEYPLEIEKPSNQALFIVQKLGHSDIALDCLNNNHSNSTPSDKSLLFNDGFTFANLHMMSISETDLAGVGGTQKSFNGSEIYNISKGAFEISPFLIQF